MKAHSIRAVAARRGVTLALTVLAVSGWGAFAYASWSAARTERALQSQITRLNTDRNGVAPARKQQGPETAATRTVYPAPYGTSPPTPAQVAPLVAPQTAALTSSGQLSLLVTEQAGAEQQAAPRSPSTVPASPQPSVQPITTELVTRDVPDTRRMASTTAEASDPKHVDINTASVDELNSLGGRFGRAIVAGRPYTTIDELVSKRVLTRSTFSQIKDQITAN
jgi:DNA uptake protein ComE-like DNA-binding protein